MLTDHSLRARVEQTILHYNRPNLSSGEKQLFELVRELWSELNKSSSEEVPVVEKGKQNASRDSCVEEYYAMLNETFRMLGADYQENITLLTQLLGKLFGATCALYNRLDGDILSSIGQWSVPEGYNPVDRPEGHICYDVIQNAKDQMLVISNLPDTIYAVSDPNVKQYGLKTYIGKAVFSNGNAVGALCALYQGDMVPGDSFQTLMNIISNAIGVEETRRKSYQALLETEEKLQALINATPDVICFKDASGRWIQANDSILKLYHLQHVDYRMKSDSELLQHTSGIFKQAFNDCTSTDEMAWKTGGQIRVEELVSDIHGNHHRYDVIKVPLFNDDNSRKGLVVFGRDITQLKEAQVSDEFLSQASLAFLEMDDNENIYDFIGLKIAELAQNCIVLVTSFDENTQVMTSQSLFGIHKMLDKVLKVIGQHPVGMSVKLTPERKQEVLLQKLTTRKDLFELLSGALNKFTCNALEKIFDIGTIYEMGFARRNYLLGDVTIITPSNYQLEKVKIIESFVKIASVALHRRLVIKDVQNSEESYRGLFNSITSAVYIMNRQGNFLDVNKGAEAMYGYPKERFIGHTPAFLSAPGKNDLVDVPGRLMRTFEGKSQVFEFWGLRSNGEIFPKEVRFYPGKYFGQEAVIVVANDITEQYQMISQLVKSKEIALENLQKTNSIIKAFPDSVFIFNSKGELLESFSDDEKNKTLTQAMNFYSAPHADIRLQEVVALTLLNISQVLKTGQLHKYEFTLEENHTLKYFGATMVKLNDEKVLSVVSNTTEKMELIDALFKAKEKAEESDRLKTAFLHNISHEIRTPMNGIVGFSNLITQPGINENDLHEYNAVINSCSNQLLSIITDIVNIATLEAGQEKVSESVVNLNEMLHLIYYQLIAKASEKNIQLAYSTALKDADALVITDETKLTQILSNLINNAIKFTDKGNIKYGYVKDGDFLKFTIEDNGIGIPEDMHEAVFERFRQATNNLAGNFGGTGLGLSISKSYVELLGGKIWLESELNKGTVFYFTIPYKSATHAVFHNEETNDSAMNNIPSGVTILIAEDEIFNFRLLEAMLSPFEFQILHAVDGTEAVQMCRENDAIALVLMDLKMPGISGFEATRQIRRIKPGLTIIAQSALTLQGDKESALTAGCNDYIAKPINQDVLISLLGKYLK
ncbi:MAG: PAS domain S-box protein [Lentimicrobiaceae bacterium]|nr:PAS domain S-box protein [Lentimicrobiaceae bacterium]